MTEVEKKTERLVRMLADNALDAVILNSQHNFAWLTGGGSNGVDLSRDNGVASLLVLGNGRRFLLANNIEMPRMLNEQLSPDDFEPIEFRWQDERSDPRLIIDKSRRVAGLNAKIAVDLSISLDAPVIESAIAGCRYSLTTEEVDRFRHLGKEAAAAMDRAVEKVKPGETEIQIAGILRRESAVNDITSVVTLVAADERIDRYRHPLPTTKRFAKTLLVVTCAKRHGLIASLSRMVSIGQPSDRLKTRTEAAARVHAALLNATRPGATGADLYRVAGDAYTAEGFGDEIDRHHQGGAAGYRTRDWVAHPTSRERVQMDQAFAWNPSITGTKVEETCLVTNDGVETITASSNVPVITTTIEGREYRSPGIVIL